ncbi:hypothetical protein BT93_C1187 [Corymbia citriodora subsp. variegata]|nr:hypothetical protein BT93_C1187 [Corymbia citriodora subsp. variegata]
MRRSSSCSASAATCRCCSAKCWMCSRAGSSGLLPIALSVPPAILLLSIIQAHSELQCYLGMDVDPMAHQMAKTKIDSLSCGDSSSTSSNLRGYFLLRNFRFIKSVVDEIGDELMDSGFDGILMDLGVSSMQVNNAERGFSVLNDGPLDMRMDPQASLKAEDILNSWPESEVGRILREYGEESNWFFLQNKIVKSRIHGGLHSTGDLVNLIQNSTPKIQLPGQKEDKVG